MDRLSAAYVAGYFDAEGCVRVPPTATRWRLEVSFGQTDARVIKRLCREYGGKLYDHGTRYERSAVKWALMKRQDVVAFLLAIRPFVKRKAR